MNKKVMNVFYRGLAGLLALVLVLGAAPVTLAREATADSGTHTDSIRKVDGVEVDWMQYLDQDKVFRLPDTIDPKEEISIIITVDETTLLDAYEAGDRTMSFREYALESEEAAQLCGNIQTRKDSILSRLEEQGIAFATGEEYSTVLSGFELLITAEDFASVCSVLGDGEEAIIGEVYQRAETELVENTVNVYSTGIFDSSNVPYDGTGMVVAVLDTGLDSNHTAFSLENFTSDNLGLTYEDVAAVVGQTKAAEQFAGLGVDDVYINEKVPFGFDYADNDPDVYSTHNNHGTHVSGVIVGKDDVITGVAPNAQLVSMKIFSDIMDTARSAWIMAALEDCVILGVDVINMSIGTSAGFSRESDEEALSGVYDRLRESGISMVVAASNSYSSAYGSEANGNLALTSNPDTGTVGSPSTYDGVLSVASISGTETPYLLYNGTIIYFDESNSGASEENDFCETLLGDQEKVEIEFVVIPGVGRSADYTGLDVTGKVALVRRGDNTFEEKAIIAQAQGAAGIIVYNNVSGEIKMNVGDATLASCSISQDDGQMLMESGGGVLTISREQTSGPFISDFSSWGPTPSLEIKPEITGHGGNILSSITGGGYDRLSGTSMACPNLAGVVVLLTQYVVENFPEIAEDRGAVSDMVYQLLMSTADIALNTNGLPYSVRKQGAGLANLYNATLTPAYITTLDRYGEEMDKPKLELGDDPQKLGVYEMTFSIHNIGQENLSYSMDAYVMTEGVSDTKTNAGETTVTEEAYILSGASWEILSVENGTAKGSTISVEAGQSAKVTVRLTLSDSDKQYLDESFANGMYVEGYITLEATKGTDIDLNIPYLAFYGDWTKAPLFDLEYYETNADELNKGLDEEDKLKADAYATRLIGGLTGDYVSYLGSYYFLQDEQDMAISADKKYIALSNQEGTIHALRYAWTGMLRNAAEITVTVTDDATGEVIFETVDTMVRKSYGDGGSLYPANVEIEFDALDYNLPNNSTYTVRMEGVLDYGDGGVNTNEKNVYEFPLTIDFEAPAVTDVEFYTEYDKTNDENKLFAKVAIYDNHYAMSAQLGYVTMETDSDGNETATMKSFQQYMTPVYSQENSTTYVTFELTDHIYDLKEGALNSNTFVVTCYDYALNYATYEIELPDDYNDFYFDDLNGEELVLSPNEVYTLAPLVEPASEWAELLEFTSSRPSVARIVNNQIVAVSSGSARIKVRDPQTNKDVTFKVTVLSEEDEGYRRYDKPVADVFELTGFYTVKAYYMLSSEDKLIGDSGDTRFFGGNYSLSMYPSESVALIYKLDAYFPADTTVQFESSNESIVKVNEIGQVTAVAEGFASVTVKVLQDDRSTYYSQTVSVEVKDPYVTTGASLTHYYGNGGAVIIPTDLHLTEIGNFAFSNFDYVEKNEEELAFDDAETSKQWYIGESSITKVVIPEGVEKIGAYAFANLTALEEVVFPSTLQFIEYGAFYGCTNLKTITFSGENNLKTINKSAFESCGLEGVLDLSAICVISDYAFAGNDKLEGILTADTLLSIGQYAFAGCKSLSDVTITSAKVKYGAYAFTDCEALTEFYVNAAVLPEGMFYECRTLEKVTVGPDVKDIGEFAFRSTNVSEIEIAQGNETFKVQSAGVVLSADGSTLVAVAPSYRDAFTGKDAGSDSITAVGSGAFSHNTRITSVSLPNVTEVGEYAFASNDSLTEIELGTLTQIGDYAFFETSITQMPGFNAQTQMGKYAFSFTDLTQVVIPDGMTVAEGCFAECMALETVVIGNDVTLGKYAFSVDKDNSFTIKSYTAEPNLASPLTMESSQEETEPVEDLFIPDDETDSGEHADNMEMDTGIEGKDEEEAASVVDSGKRFYYELSTALTSLTIGENAVIGDNAFQGAACLESVTLGANAQIGYMSFYNNSMLKEIDLSQVKSIGDYAFSGDVYYICLDDSMSVAAVSSEGMYLYSYHASMLESVDLSAAVSVGEFAFAYCRSLKDVKLGEAITELSNYLFAGCIALETVDLTNVTAIGDYAFSECESLTRLELPAVETIGEYAFVYGAALESVILGGNTVSIGEGAFSYCEKLSTVDDLFQVKELGDYAFAYTALSSADLTGAEKLGSGVFLKQELTPFTVTLGDSLKELGDNPFALCDVDLGRYESVIFNGNESQNRISSYTLSGNIFVEDGSLYQRTNNGLELIAYGGSDAENYVVAEDTVRIAAMAFAGRDVTMVTLPKTLKSIGHKAFYLCDKLDTVVMNSYDAPVLEEEFDPNYYNSLAHIPGTGDFGTYTDYDGTVVTIEPAEILPYFMWNATGGFYSNVYYGASFQDYLGYVEDKLTLVRPVNGKNYDSFIWQQYFDRVIDGPAAPDSVTMEAIQAIRDLGSKVSYEDKAKVEAARALYAKIATLEQQALVTNYADLISAEQRIIALTPVEEPVVEEEKPETSGNVGIVIALVAVAVLCGIGYCVFRQKRDLFRRKKATSAEAAPEKSEPLETVEFQMVKILEKQNEGEEIVNFQIAEVQPEEE